MVREIRTAAAIHDVDHLWSGSSKERGTDLSLELVVNRPLFHLLAGSAYPHAGFSVNTGGDTSKLYGGILLQWERWSPFLFATGIGLALHDGCRETDDPHRKSLGSHVLFRIPIELGYAFNDRHRISLAFDHVSNAGLASPNEGLDTLGIMYGYRF